MVVEIPQINVKSLGARRCFGDTGDKMYAPRRGVNEDEHSLVHVCKVRNKDFPTQQRWVVDMWSLYQSVKGTSYLAYAFHNWFSCSSFAGLDHAQEPCSAMDCWNAAWMNWVGKMEVSSKAGDSIWIFLQVFDGMVGVVLLCIHLLSLLGWGAHMRRSSDSTQSCKDV